jgi:hypothetical protein
VPVLLLADTVDYLHDAHAQGKRILIEGANATMLDVDHGTYPFVTSSNPSIGGIVTGLGIAPTTFEAIIGVVSCYLTSLLSCGLHMVALVHGRAVWWLEQHNPSRLRWGHCCRLLLSQPTLLLTSFIFFIRSLSKH